MEDQACPRCKTTKYRNPSLKLLVNVCGHALCENCVELLFVKGSGSCVECGIPLRRSNFRVQLFEDASVEKEVDIRKRILKDYNKKEEDFETLRQYNDYLEEVETIVYNLANDVEVEATRQQIEQYRKENKAFILKNKAKLSKEEECLEDIIEHEQQEFIQKRQQVVLEEKIEKSMKIKQRERLIDELMFSEAPAGQIVASHAMATQKVEKQPKENTHFSTGIKFRHKPFLPIPTQEAVPTYVYVEKTVDFNGPNVPDLERLHLHGYLANVRSADASEKAGGFVSRIACLRALQESACDLFRNCE